MTQTELGATSSHGLLGADYVMLALLLFGKFAIEKGKCPGEHSTTVATACLEEDGN